MTLEKIKQKRRMILERVRAGIATRDDDREYKRLGAAMLTHYRAMRAKRHPLKV